MQAVQPVTAVGTFVLLVRQAPLVRTVPGLSARNHGVDNCADNSDEQALPGKSAQLNQSPNFRESRA